MIKPELINPDDLLRKAQGIYDSLEEEQAEEERQQQFIATQEVQQELNEKGFQKDPKGEEVTELLENQQSDITGFPEVDRALTGVVATTAESLLSFPERVIDMTSGAMGREMAENDGEYNVSFDPLGVIGVLEDLKKNSSSRTWWGGLIEMGGHYASLAWLARGTKLFNTISNPLARDLAIGATSDLVSSESQEDNATRAIFDSQLLRRIPWAGDFLQDSFDKNVYPWLGTKPTDDPWTKTIKNAAEGVGLDMLVSKVLDRLPEGRVENNERLKNIDDQVKEGRNQELKEEADLRAAFQRDEAMRADRPQLADQAIDVEVLRDPPEIEGEAVRALPPAGTPGNQFRGFKNKSIADPWQGNAVSTKKPFDVAAQSDRLGRSWKTAGAGSTDSVFTAKQLENMARSVDVTETEFRRMMKGLVTDERYQDMLKQAKNAGQSMRATYGGAYDRVREALGRDYTDMDPDAFWSVMSRDSDTIAGLESWNSEAILAADLINASLFKQVRDMGIGMREIGEFADLNDIDGPMKATIDRLVVGLTNVKRSRYLAGAKLQGLDFSNPAAKKQMKETLDKQVSESKEALMTYLELAKDQPTDEMTDILAEFFSMSNDVHNLTDFDAYMRAKLRGGDFKDKGYSSRVVKELGSVMIHSILSGVKTPLRAMMGTFTASFARPLSTAIGASISGDRALARASLAGVNAYVQAIPEAFKLFKTNLSAYWAGDIADMKTRYTEGVSKDDESWAVMGKWAETNGSTTDKVAYRIADIARTLNSKNFLTYNTKIMGATDDAFALLMSRARAREKAMLEAMEIHKTGEHVDITPELLKEYENKFYSKLLDEDGNINLKSDLYLESQVKEATLTTELRGLSKNLETLFNNAPMLKPFFLFARTGINGLEFSAKHMPALNLFVKEQRDILFAKADDLASVKQYGIETAADLANAKALMKGRQAIGSAVVMMGGLYYATGNLTGNGPQDRRLRQLWMDTGWQPRSFKVPTPAGDVWVSYESFEPFNNILSTIADIGDNQALMGPQWAESNLVSTSLAVAGGVVSKSYLQGISQLVDLFSGEPYQIQKIAGNIANNTVPLAGLRNDIGRTLNSPMREINKNIFDTIRNRNLTSEYGPGQDLPTKYDLLNGKKIRDWNFIEKMYNLISPVNLSLNQSDGRTLLWNSNYDLRLSGYSSPDGIPLKEYPQLRSEFQKYLGQQNLEAQLDKLANRDDVIASVARMNRDLRANRKELDPMKAYTHNKLIKAKFEAARKKAWALVRQNNPDLVAELYKEQSDLAGLEVRTRSETAAPAQIRTIINYNNP
jgi:hypothetical protein